MTANAKVPADLLRTVSRVRFYCRLANTFILIALLSGLLGTLLTVDLFVLNKLLYWWGVGLVSLPYELTYWGLIGISFVIATLSSALAFTINQFRPDLSSYDRERAEEYAVSLKGIY